MSSVMVLRTALACALLWIGACAIGPGATGAPSVPPTVTAPTPGDTATPCADADAFAWLLRTGDRIPVGWEHTGAGTFIPTSDGLRTSGGIGLLWYAQRQFRDFELLLEWRVASKDDNSGVFVRFPTPTDEADAVPGGVEIQINDGAPGEPQRTGALYNVQPEQRRNSNPPGTWNRFCIRAVGDQLTVVLNGLVVNRYEGAVPRSGHIGLQNHGPDDDVTFRRVRIRELGPESSDALPTQP